MFIEIVNLFKMLLDEECNHKHTKGCVVLMNDGYYKRCVVCDKMVKIFELKENTDENT